MARVGDVRHLDSVAEFFAKSMAVLRRGDTISQSLYDEECHLAMWLRPVVVGRRAVCRSLGRSRGGPSRHLTQDSFCRRWIGHESFGRFKTLGLGRVLTKPRLKGPDDLRFGGHESDAGEQDHATDEIRTIRGQASCHSIAEAVAEHVHWPRTERFDDCGYIGSQNMQRQALQPARA